MWRQLTQRARKAIFLAQKEAEKLGYTHVRSEHLLLALITEEDCVASAILERMGLDLGTLRSEIMGRISRGSDHIGDDMQLAPDAKHSIDFAFDEVKIMKDDWVGTEHLLIGLVHEAGGLASDILSKLGVDLFTVRAQLREMKAGKLNFEHVNGGNSGTTSPSLI